MAADPSSLAPATPWRKSTRSGSTGCVEAAVLAAVGSASAVGVASVGAGGSERVL